ncbi:PREDICTED: serine/threonine-protein kinase PRP4 homolog [Ceratosolen solmsi marchali]|uniref:Serine/threonine-protein kinase PRP4 homolog n=1 Tax=Ceratosolen solmsi marchali TaxID=326594 RepID=A0AAJ7E0R6_9HYME|nr:PREDICTED: serine/threonine-protein kinase PRP4 homolog [Ceratosolen solmsi marchali]
MRKRGEFDSYNNKECEKNKKFHIMNYNGIEDRLVKIIAKEEVEVALKNHVVVLLRPKLMNKIFNLIKLQYFSRHSSKDFKSTFNGPERSQTIDSDELRKIKITIHRNLSGHITETASSQTDNVNANEIILTRRHGEGIKPIFDREEIKKSEEISQEIEEHRTIELTRKLVIDNKYDSEQNSATRNHSRDHSPSYNDRRSSTSTSTQKRRPGFSCSQRNRSEFSSSQRRRSQSSSPRRQSLSPQRRQSKLTNSQRHRPESLSPHQRHSEFLISQRRHFESMSPQRRPSDSMSPERRYSEFSSPRRRRSESSSSRRRRSPSPGKRTSSRSGALESRRHSDTRKSMSRETRRRTSSEDYKSKSNVHCTKEYRESRERRKGRSHDRRERRDSSRERRLSPTYFERMPFPGHYWGCVPRPMLTGRLMPPIGRPMMFGPRVVRPIMGPMFRRHFAMYPPHDARKS